MPKLIVSTCGTSLLTNFVRAHPDTKLSAVIRATSNQKASQLTPLDLATLEQAISSAQAELLASDTAGTRRLSAELNGLIAYHGEPPRTADLGPPDQHLLLCSDTYQGKAVAECLCAWLRQQGFLVEPLTVQDLSTDELPTFRAALARLARELGDWVSNYRSKRYGVVFNLTGGFKAVQGFVQVLGNLYADESVYIFETSNQLLRIPRLPVVPDESLEPHFTTIRRLKFFSQLTASACAGIPETLLMEDDGNCGLSEYGEALWPVLERQRYSASLLPPLSPRVRYSKRFQHEVAQLDAARRLVQLAGSHDSVRLVGRQ